MQPPRLSAAEVCRRGQEIYEREIRGQVETDQNIGKIVSIDIETGRYEIDETGIEASRRLQEEHPGAPVYGVRIGYNAVYPLGGALTRTNGR